MKLTTPQIRALEFLSRSPWVAAWWGGKPDTGWPPELHPGTFSKLFSARLVRVKHGGRFDREVSISREGLEALKRHKTSSKS